MYKGGTARLIARSCPDRTVHLFDTFGGLPATEPGLDRLSEGDFADTTLAEVQQLLRDCPRAVFHPGFFPETAQVVTDKRFSFVYLDADLYRSTRDGLEFFYPRLSVGGVILIDDYRWLECSGVEQAVQEFLRDKPEEAIVARRYQCLLVKLPDA